MRISDHMGSQSSTLGAFDNAVCDFMDLRDIPGGSLSITVGGRVALSRGYTRTEDPSGPILPTSLFRIASVSKPLCAVAVLQLVESGKLRLDDKLYECLDLPRSPLRAGEHDPGEITILHLLQHQAGWDRGVSFDPHSIDRAISAELGKKLPITRDDIVAYVSRRPLDFAPGTRYAYSNYGYQLLGHIVEKLTGCEYTPYVAEHVLAPLGIVGPRQGLTLREDRAEGEVEYHTSNPNLFGNVMDSQGHQDVTFPYGGYNLENMVTSGGWIASTLDLVRFAAAFDDAANCPILGKQWVEFMFAPPAANRFLNGGWYGCGWAMTPRSRGIQASHGGCLQGVTASLRRREDGVCFCALFNRREETTPYSWDIDGALNEIADAMSPADWVVG